MINLTEYIDVENEVRVIFEDNSSIVGRIGTVEDEEESGLGEIGITLYTSDGGYLGIGQSEIQSIEIL